MSQDIDLATTPQRGGVLRLDVVTPAGVAVRKDVDTVEAPSVDGEFGVLPGHLPLLAALKAGVVRYRSEGKTFVLAVGAGFAEAGADLMTILTDRCLEAKDIDVAKARTSSTMLGSSCLISMENHAVGCAASTSASLGTVMPIPRYGNVAPPSVVNR